MSDTPETAPVLRPANIEHDAAAFVRQKDMATGYALSATLGTDYEALMTELFCAGDTLQSHTRTAVALVNDRTAGHVSLIPASEFAARRRASAALLGRNAFTTGWWLRLQDIRRRIRGIALGPWSPGQLYIESLAVDPALRRHGIATQLIAHALDQAQTDGATALSLNTRRGNTAALSLYTASGFVVTRQRGPHLRLQLDVALPT